MRLNTRLGDARAWRGASLEENWRFELGEEMRVALGESIARVGDRRVIEVDPDPGYRTALQSIKRVLEEGPGFVVIEGIDPLYPADQAIQAYWTLGQCLGRPLEQNIEGDLLYDVLDTGREVSTGARFSVTNAESTFHIDRAFSPRIPDYVGLLCLQSALSGGQSQLISAYALHDALLEENPGVLEELYGDYCFDRRGQYLEGEDPVHRAPIMAWDGRELTMRYLRYYIEVGHQRAEMVLSEIQLAALDAVEALLQRPEFRIEFELSPGQMLFTNNHWILHNRTAFEDDPESRRHYVRLWLGRRED